MATYLALKFSFLKTNYAANVNAVKVDLKHKNTFDV